MIEQETYERVARRRMRLAAFRRPDFVEVLGRNDEDQLQYACLRSVMASPGSEAADVP
jgi:hypothetical protein